MSARGGGGAGFTCQDLDMEKVSLAVAAAVAAAAREEDDEEEDEEEGDDGGGGEGVTRANTPEAVAARRRVGEEAGGEWAARRHSARAGSTPSTRGTSPHSAAPRTGSGRKPPTARLTRATPHTGGAGTGSTLSHLPSPSERGGSELHDAAFRAELRAAAPSLNSLGRAWH